MRALKPILASFLALGTMSLASSCDKKPTERPEGDSSLLAQGELVPDLQRTAHDGTDLELRALGKTAVVYFYPKDDTPGCTAEACAFRDAWDRYTEAGVLVIGVSTDDDESHKAFSDKYELPFPLVADPDETWTQAFGVPVKNGFANRVSFLIDAEGKVVEVYPGVDPGIHADQVLDDAAKL